MRRAKIGLALGILALLVAATPAAGGPLMLRVDAGSAGVVEVVDQGAGDLNPLLGGVTFLGSLGGFLLNVTTGVSAPLIGNPGSAELALLSLTVASTVAGPLAIWISDDDFSLEGLPLGTPLTALAAVGGELIAPSNSSARFQSWVNPDNVGALPGGVIPPGRVPIFTPSVVATSTGLLTPFAFSSSATFDYGGSFALFSRAILEFTGPGVIAFTQASQVPVPEPASVFLMGSGLAALAGLARRRRHRR